MQLHIQDFYQNHSLTYGKCAYFVTQILEDVGSATFAQIGLVRFGAAKKLVCEKIATLHLTLNNYLIR